MILPELPAKVDKRSNQINKFLGLNWTENYTVGELRDSIGLTSENYPCLSQRLGISKSDLFADVTDIFEYSNNIVTVSLTGEDEYTLHINGDPITTVDSLTAGSKQFTVIGKRLIVWPDAIMIEDGVVTPFDDKVAVGSTSPMYVPTNYSGSGAYNYKRRLGITHNSVTTTYISNGPQYNSFYSKYPLGTNIAGKYGYFYGFDTDAVEACFHDGEWDLERLKELEQTYALSYDPVAHDNHDAVGDYPCLLKGMVLILDDSGNLVMADEAPYKYNASGRYWADPRDPFKGPTSKYTDQYTCTYVVTSTTAMKQYATSTSTTLTTITASDTLYYAGNANNEDYAYLKVTQNGTDYVGYVLRSMIALTVSVGTFPAPSAADGLQAAILGNSLFTDKYLHQGYRVSISGTRYGLYDKSGITVVDATYNKLTFPDNTFDDQAKYCYEAPSALSAGTYVFKAGNDYYTVTTTDVISKGHVVIIKPYESDTVYVWNPVLKEYTKEYNSTKASTGSGEKTMTLYEQANPDGTMVITKDVPQMDFICESNNRLWGVSNEDDTIYASALGDPTDWWSTGFDDSAYQLAVASEDPFTAIVEYGNAVLAWKEYSVTKIMGSYPSQYYSAEYQYAGVQDGAHDCVRVINGVLFYKGVHGFYAYQSTPNLISDKLGDPMLYGTHAGSDGNRYYCCVHDADSGYSVLVYDLSRGIWLKESEDKVDGYIYDSAYKVCGFISGGDLFYYDADSTERVEWKAEFCPFIEGTTSNSVYTVLMGKKGYTRLVVFADMAENSFIKMEIKEDNKPWREIGTKKATYPILFRQPIRLGRCAKVALKISGRGRVMIKAITREYLAGSDR